MTKCFDFYIYKGKWIKHNAKLNGWVIEGNFNLYKALVDCENAIRKSNDSSQKAEPRILRKMTTDEFIHAFSD